MSATVHSRGFGRQHAFLQPVWQRFRGLRTRMPELGGHPSPTQAHAHAHARLHGEPSGPRPLLTVMTSRRLCPQTTAHGCWFCQADCRVTGEELRKRVSSARVLPANPRPARPRPLPTRAWPSSCRHWGPCIPQPPGCSLAPALDREQEARVACSVKGSDVCEWKVRGTGSVKQTPALGKGSPCCGVGRTHAEAASCRSRLLPVH